MSGLINLRSLFDTPIDRSKSLSSRWGGIPENTITLTIGDVDFAMPMEIRRAINTRMEHGVLGYDTIPESLSELIVDRMKRLYHWKIEPEWLVYLPGVVGGLNLAARGLTSPDQAIVTERVVYYPVLDAAINANRSLKKVRPILTAGYWQFGMEEFQAHARDKASRLLMLCNPQNPLGRVMQRDELEKIAEICLQQGLVICADEIHSDIVFEQSRHIPIASLSPEIAEITVTLMSPSKAFAISGLGGGFAIIANRKLRQAFCAAGEGILPNLNVFSIAALEAAYRDCDGWLLGLVEYLTESRNLVHDRLAGISGIKALRPQGTYFTWLDVRNLELKQPYSDILAAGVELSDGEKFGDRNFLRLNFGSPHSVLNEALDRITVKLSR